MSKRRYRRPSVNLHEHARYQREDLLFLLRAVLVLRSCQLCSTCFVW